MSQACKAWDAPSELTPAYAQEQISRESGQGAEHPCSCCQPPARARYAAPAKPGVPGASSSPLAGPALAGAHPAVTTACGGGR